MVSVFVKRFANAFELQALWIQIKTKKYSFRITRSYSEEGTNSNSSSVPVVFSGIQPTGAIHLGNYLGAIRKWIELQERNNTIYCIVDMHSITLPYDHKDLKDNILSLAATLIACGINPNKSILYQQSKVLEHASLFWILSCLTTMPRLSRFPQFKEKSALFGSQSVPTGLFLYPILQTADILIHKTTHVPVGEDQSAHINMAADLAEIFNKKYGKTFPIPQSIIYADTLARIKSLRDPTSKMSKSEKNPKSRISLLDSPETVQENIKKAVTDFISEVYFDPVNRPGVSNLMTIHHALSGKSYESIQEECKHIDTGKYKLLLADIIIEYLMPIRLEALKLLDDKQYLMNILDQGAERASEKARHTLKEVFAKVGF